MRYAIQSQPSYSVLVVSLEPGESIVAESGAMAWMEGPIATQTSSRGGMLSGLKRKFLTGESFFQNTYTAEGGQGRIAFAPGRAGDIVAYELEGNDLLLEKGAYLASTQGVECDSKWQGLKGFFSEGLFALRTVGTGTLFFNAYGDIHEIQVDGQYTVDNGFIVAWEPSLQYRITRARRVRSFLFADQLLVHYTGTGRIWVQSRSTTAFADWIYPFRPVKSKSN